MAAVCCLHLDVLKAFFFFYQHQLELDPYFHYPSLLRCFDHKTVAVLFIQSGAEYNTLQICISEITGAFQLDRSFA